MTIPRFVPLVLLALLLAAGCDHTITSFSHDGFSTQAGANAVLLRNQSAEAVHYVALDEGSAAVADPSPPEFWPTVAPHAQVTLPYDRMVSLSSSRPAEIRIYWWTNGAYHPTIHLDVP